MHAPVASKGAHGDEALIATIFVDSLKGWSNSPFGIAFSALLARDYLTSRLLTLQLLQELTSQ